VKADLLSILIFILALYFLLLRREPNNRLGIIIAILFTYCLLSPHFYFEQSRCQRLVDLFLRKAEKGKKGLKSKKPEAFASGFESNRALGQGM